MERLLVAASTPLLTNISLAINDLPAGCEVYPFPIPDLFCGNPLIVSGRFNGRFPSTIKVMGFLPNRSTWGIEIKVQIGQHIPLRKVFAKQQLDMLTAQAWLQEDRQFKQQAVNLSLVTGVPCEYTCMMSFETTKEQFAQLVEKRQRGKKVNLKKFSSSKGARITLVGGLAIGFGSIAATAGNLPIADGLMSFDWVPDLGGLSDSISCCDCDCDCDGIGDLCSCCDCTFCDLGGCDMDCLDTCLSCCMEVLCGCCSAICS